MSSQRPGVQTQGRQEGAKKREVTATCKKRKEGGAQGIDTRTGIAFPITF